MSPLEFMQRLAALLHQNRYPCPPSYIHLSRKPSKEA